MYCLFTLGRLSLERDGTPVPNFDVHRRGLAILAILAAEGHTSRDRLMALLWPDSDTVHARGSLKQALYQLRHVLGAFDLVQGSVVLSLNPATIETDIGRFIAALERGDQSEAVALYSGPFLDGVHLGGPPELEQWVEARRAELRHRWAGALKRLAVDAEERGDPRSAADRWRQLQAADPADSRIVLRLMQALEAAGQRAAAIEHARNYQRRLRDEWDLSPDPAVDDLARRLRSASRPPPPPQPALPYAETTAPSTTSPAATAPAPRLTRVMLAAAVALAIAIGLGALHSRRPPGDVPGDPNLVAVAPFHVMDSSLALWREGLADMLTRDLDGAGPLRTVGRALAFRDWPGGVTRADARALGSRTGAGLVVYGSVVRKGRDTVALRASVLARTSGIIADIEVRGAEQRMGALADSLVVRILGTLGRVRPIASARRVSIGAHSLPALRQFLRGEQLYRRGLWDSALTHYDQAVAQEPDFALALRRMAQVVGWGVANRQGHGTWAEYLGRATSLNHRLSPRDSLMLLADSLRLAAEMPANPDALPRDLYGVVEVLEEAARRYPQDPDIWYELGDVRHHYPPPIRAPLLALEAFERAIELDPGFGPAYDHMVELALLFRRPDRAADNARKGAALASGAEPSVLQVAALVLDSGVAAAAAIRALAAAPPLMLTRLGTEHLAWATDSSESAITILRELVTGRHAKAVSGHLLANPLTRPLDLAWALAFRGRLRTAADLVLSAYAGPRAGPVAARRDPFLELALFGAISDSVAKDIFSAALSSDAKWGAGNIHAPPSELRGAPWWFARQDTAALHQLATRAAAVAQDSRSRTAGMRGRYANAAATAYLTLARGDSLRAVQLLRAIPDTLCWVTFCVHEKVLLARLLAASGADEEAAHLIDYWSVTAGSTPSAVLAALERGRMAERLADTATARDRYQFVSEAWRHADPALLPFVADARGGLRRLGRRRPTDGEGPIGSMR